MGFNFGAFGKGLSEGITSGSNLLDQIQQRKLREAQLNAFNNANLGQQAFTNSMIPGATPVPYGASAGGGIGGVLSQVPIVGQIGQELGLWGSPPGSAAPMPAGGRAPQPGGGWTPQTVPTPAPQASGRPAPAPAAPPAMPAGQPAPAPASQASGVPSPQAIASAVDTANPGLRQGNPAAYANAVRLAIEHANQAAGMQLDMDYKRAQITGMGSENDLRKAQAANIPVQTDLTRAQIQNQKMETEVKQGELLLQPQKQRIKEAELKLKEIEQDAAQAKMRLDEAEINAKNEDYGSQRELRDAQIANMRNERLLKMRKQKLDELKGTAEVGELSSRSAKQEAEAGYIAKKGDLPADKDKLINTELTKAQMQLRFHQGQANDLLMSMNPNDPVIQQRIMAHNREAEAYGARVKDLEGQLSTAKKPEGAVDNPFQQIDIPVPRQQELGKVSQKFLDFARNNDEAGAERLKNLLVSKGIPQHEINWILDNARVLGQTAPATVPQSR